MTVSSLNERLALECCVLACSLSALKIDFRIFSEKVTLLLFVE